MNALNSAEHLSEEIAHGPRGVSEDNSAGTHRWMATEENAGERLDVFLASHLSGQSRSALQRLIESGRVLVNHGLPKRSHRIRTGEEICVDVPAPEPDVLSPEEFPLEVLYEDSELAVINKPAGIVVHPGAGRNSGTLVSALLHRFSSLSHVGGPLRPGIVHRLDKGTSGALIVARTDTAHRRLVEKFQAREIQKNYVALVHGNPSANSGRIELPVARDLHRRTRMTTRRREGRFARTDWNALERIGPFTLIDATLHTGRTHQLRVHFSALGHPILGDTLYGAPHTVHAGKETLPPLERIFLHAARLRFLHPISGAPIEVRAPLPRELRNYLHSLATALHIESAKVDAALKTYL